MSEVFLTRAWFGLSPVDGSIMVLCVEPDKEKALSVQWSGFKARSQSKGIVYLKGDFSCVNK